MVTLEVMRAKVQSTMSVKRYIHTLGVVQEAQKLADAYGDEVLKNQAEIAGLLHDCAKEYPLQIRQQFCKEYKIGKEEIFKEVPDLIHPFLGAEVAKREYLVEDSSVLNAIKYHTTGRPEMDSLEKIIYIADYIEPSRAEFPELGEARRLAYINLDSAMEYILETTIAYVEQHGRKIHPLSTEAFEYYKR